MSWTKKTVNNMLVATNTVTLSTTGTQYTDAIDFITLGGEVSKYATFFCQPSLVSGTNLDVSLYGSADNSTYYQLKDALVTDLSGTTGYGASIDLKTYPAPYYKVGFSVDSDETGNTVAVTLMDNVQ